MKRIVSLFLSVLMFLCCVIPVSADNSFFDSSTNGYSFDVTPYLDSTLINFSGTGSATIHATLNTSDVYNYVDMVFRTDSTDFSIGTYSQFLTVLKISDGFYRAFGRLKYVFDSDVNLYFDHRNGSYVNISTLIVSPVDYTVDYIPLEYSISGTYKRQIVDIWSNTPAVNEWLDIDVNGSITDGQILSPTIQPNINIDGTFRDNNSSRILLTTRLKFDWRRFDRVDLYFYNNFDELVDYACYVGSINVVSSIQQVFIENQSATLVTLDFSNLNRFADNSNCTIRIRGYTTLSSDSSQQLFFIHNTVGFVKTVSTNFWPSWLIKIIDKLDNIFTGRGEDQSAADSFNDSINDQADELEDLTADLNSVTRPPLSDVNLSTSGMIDQSVVVLSTNGIGSILSNQIILRVLIMSLTFALAGFILFGKR